MSFPCEVVRDNETKVIHFFDKRKRIATKHQLVGFVFATKIVNFTLCRVKVKIVQFAPFRSTVNVGLNTMPWSTPDLTGRADEID